MTTKTVNTRPPIQTRVMSKREAAEYMRITVSGVNSLIVQGRLRVVKYPGILRYLIDRLAVDQLIEESKTYMGPPPPAGSKHGIFEAAYGIKTHSVETMAAAKKKRPQ